MKGTSPVRGSMIDEEAEINSGGNAESRNAHVLSNTNPAGSSDDFTLAGCFH